MLYHKALIYNNINLHKMKKIPQYTCLYEIVNDNLGR